MDLWIRSQNKEWFGKIDNIEARECSAGMIVRLQDATYSDEYDIYANGDIWVGTYENRERALEVLDEIQNKIENTIYIPSDINDVSKQVYTPPFMIYEMPEE